MNYEDKKKKVLKEIIDINKFYHGYKYASLSENETIMVEEIRQKEVSAALSMFTPDEWDIFQEEELQKYREATKKK